MPPNPTRRRSMLRTISHFFNTNNATPSTATSPGPPPGPVAALSGGHDLERTRSVSSQAERDADLALAAQDLLFLYQLEQQDPRRLGPNAFYVAGIAPSPYVSNNIYQVLQRNSIISLHEHDWRVYCDRISRTLPGQLPFLTPPDLHRLVGTLFYWEQEQIRWGLIEDRIKHEKTAFETESKARRADAESDAALISSSPPPPPPPPPMLPPPPLLPLPSAETEAETRLSETGAEARSGSIGSENIIIDTSQAEQTPQENHSEEGDSSAQSSYDQHVDGLLAQQQMRFSFEHQAFLEQHKLALAHLENSKRVLPSQRDRVNDAPPPAPDGTERPPAYGDFHNSIAVMGSLSRDDVSLIYAARRAAASAETGNDPADGDTDDTSADAAPSSQAMNRPPTEKAGEITAS